MVAGGPSKEMEVDGAAPELEQPRPAPSYTPTTFSGESPGPRCGHTLTSVAAVGEPGTPGYIGPRLILFGGATALEGGGGPAAGGAAGISRFRNQNVHCGGN